MFGDTRTPPVVKNLIIINALMFLAQSLLPIGGAITDKLALYYWASPNFQFYQFVTHMFLHANISHLFFNMFALWMFGRVVEYDMGSRRFTLFYFVTGVGAALFFLCAKWWEITRIESALPGGMMTQQLYALINSGMEGASGAVYGVLLAFGMFHPDSRIMLLIPPIPMKAKYFVIAMMVIELGLNFMQPGSTVAHLAHVGGMIWGYLLIRYWRSQRR